VEEVGQYAYTYNEVFDGLGRSPSIFKKVKHRKYEVFGTSWDEAKKERNVYEYFIAQTA